MEKITQKNILKKAVEVLEKGGVILYPTDTIWGLGCDAENEEAVKRIFKIKMRDEAKSVISLVLNQKMINRYVKLAGSSYKLFTQEKEPQTVIVKNVKNLANNIITKENTAAFRVPKHNFCKKLLKCFNKAIVSTSANVSGEQTNFYFETIPNSIKESVDFIVPQKYEGYSTHKPSRIVYIDENNLVQYIRK